MVVAAAVARKSLIVSTLARDFQCEKFIEDASVSHQIQCVQCTRVSPTCRQNNNFRLIRPLIVRNYIFQGSPVLTVAMVTQ